MSSVLEEATFYEEQIIKDRRYLHQYPEIGFDVPNTQKFIQQRLDEIGIEHQACGHLPSEISKKYAKAGFGKQENCTGIVATIGKGSPCILLRADMDALPIHEEVESDFKSKKEGMMHACGHDSHVAMLLGAAQILKNRETELQGTVKLFFQPGEEWGYGSKLMIDDGALDNPKVDAALGIHIMPDQEAGTLSVHKGTLSQAMDTYMIDITGSGGHSSQPHKTVDPNMITNQLYTSLNLLFTREADPSQKVTFSVGSMSGGTATNIIPGTATLSGNMRNYNQETRDHLCERIPEMIDHVVKAWRGEYKVIEFHTPTTYNDPAFIDVITPALEEIMGKENITDEGVMSGSEDFSYISQNVPSAFLVLGTGKEGDAPVHNSRMEQREEMFKYGAAVHANVAIEWLKAQ